MTLQAGKMYRPTDVAFDTTGNAVYVVEQFNHRVSKWIYQPGSFVFSLADGNITALSLDTPGTGTYTTVELVIEGPTGTATADATVSTGEVATIAVTDGGSDYTTAPNVEIISVEGTLATATASIENGTVTEIIVTNGGSGYLTGTQILPLVVIDAPEGKSRATATATGSGAAVTAVTLTGNGNGYDGATTVSIVSNSGNNGDAVVTATFTASTWGSNNNGTTGQAGPIGDGGSTDTSLNRPSGIAFNSGSSLLYVTDTFHNRVRVIDSSTGLFDNSLGTGGSADDEFYYPAGIAINPGEGIVVVADELNSRAVRYVVNGTTLDTPTVLDVLSGINSLIIDTPGSGYTGSQTVTISAPPTGGTTATGTAVIGATGVIDAISAIGGTNSGYLDGESITLTDVGAGVNAAGTAVISGGVIQSVTFTNRGSGYTATDVITITGNVSTTATATFTVDSIAANAVSSITIVLAGSGYTAAPTVTIDGTVGSGATATATIGGRSFVRPHGMTYDVADSTFNVGDSLRSVISSFNDAGTFQNQYGTPRSNGTSNTFLFYPGSGKGQLTGQTPTVFANTRNNNIRTIQDSVIQVTTGDGSTSGTGDGELYWPESISAASDTAQYVLAANTYNNRVEIYSSAVAVLTSESPFNFGSP